jgi:hypothetical protein
MTSITGVHPYAEKFPKLPDDELAELAESIRANGLRQPIVVTPDGLILDGRNRWAACQLAQVEPETVVYEGDDLAEYVMNVNVERRHMSTGARAMAAARVLEAAGRRDHENRRWEGVRGRPVIRPESGTNPKTWNNLLAQAGVVLDHAPALAAQVVADKMALDHAYRQAQAVRDAERLRNDEAAARAYVEEHAPELIELVADGTYGSHRELVGYARLIAEERARGGRSAREHQRLTNETYTRLARMVHTLAQLDKSVSLGGVGRDVMEEYDPSGLDPTTGVGPRDLEPDSLRRAAHFLAKLAEWAERRAKP